MTETEKSSVRYKLGLHIINIEFCPYKVNVISFVLPTAACLLNPGSLETIIIS
jgi:hypothetical protein